MTVKTEMDEKYQNACFAERMNRASEARDDEPRQPRPHYCHECRRSYGHSIGCPNEPPLEGDDDSPL